MKKTLIALGSAICLMVSSLSSVAQASEPVDQSNPYQLIEQVADNTFSRLRKDRTLFRADPDLLRDVVKDELLPYIHTRYAASLVLGAQYYRKATPAQRDAFTEAFTEYMIASYAQILLEYDDQAVKVQKDQPIAPDDKIVKVRVDITDPSRPPIRLDFSLRKNTRTGNWQAYDVTAEGVSMIQSKQSEWKAPLRRDGIDSVIGQLKTLAERPIRREDKQKQDAS
ncbi:phospholipid-binding protein MlaC [Salinivibrio kushneri]|uniref:phospholipid-binding protein MlaC n=1 Tax=Salinivibrio kushneri TaxID=1908198 RepID=UPI000988FB71|nr:phospholipid-binding protein MlaC [Salinivibrio kushneri]OOE50526.1 phospholipid-binding protein MlaC [Salinivibrio kushneri]OOE56631.1 phospholipid-binding protein MlaC [Salinivibrio kushneri]